MPFVKGQSGNPKGAPKKEQTLSKILEKEVNRLVSEVKDKDGNVIEKVKGKKCIAKAYCDIAFNKKYPVQIRLKALELITERIDGKARQNVSVEGEVKTTKQTPFDVISENLDKLSPDERDMYFELCEKMNDSVSN